jgi:hypothetical protein
MPEVGPGSDIYSDANLIFQAAITCTPTATYNDSKRPAE